MEQLDDVLSKHPCLLYGAGKVAKAIVQYASKRNYKIEGILVSKKQGNPNNIMGIPVWIMEKYHGDFSGKYLIISAMENLHKELADEVSSENFEKQYFISNELFQQVRFTVGDYGLECLSKIEKLKEEVAYQEMRLLRFVPRPCLEYMVLNILDHCNLRCKGCDHFACVADPYFVAYESIHNDLARLSEIFHGDYIMQIAVMGGEPLLHPDLLKILRDVRKHFPHTIIRLTTNGLLLLKQRESFWKACRDYDVTIVNTKYPINLDFEKMEEKARCEGGKFQFFEGTGNHVVKKALRK